MNLVDAYNKSIPERWPHVENVYEYLNGLRNNGYRTLVTYAIAHNNPLGKTIIGTVLSVLGEAGIRCQIGPYVNEDRHVYDIATAVYANIADTAGSNDRYIMIKLLRAQIREQMNNSRAMISFRNF